MQFIKAVIIRVLGIFDRGLMKLFPRIFCVKKSMEAEGNKLDTSTLEISKRRSIPRQLAEADSGDLESTLSTCVST